MMRKRLFDVSVVAVCAVALVPFLPEKIAVNPSASAPKGFYLIEKTGDNSVKVGDFIVISVPQKFRNWVVERQYLAPGIPLLKQVVALSGDRICAVNRRIFINGNYKSKAQKVDARGRGMPQLSGCFTLKADQFFALMPAKNSLDSRYFGALELKNIEGIARPIWVWNSEGDASG